MQPNKTMERVSTRVKYNRLIYCKLMAQNKEKCLQEVNRGKKDLIFWLQITQIIFQSGLGIGQSGFRTDTHFTLSNRGRING